MKKISSVFALLFMFTAFAVPLFPMGVTEDCCCGEGCMCEINEEMSCGMEITSCQQLPIMPIPVAPLNKVTVDQPNTLERQTATDTDSVVDQIAPTAQVQTRSNDPPSDYQLPLLI